MNFVKKILPYLLMSGIFIAILIFFMYIDSVIINYQKKNQDINIDISSEKTSDNLFLKLNPDDYNHYFFYCNSEKVTDDIIKKAKNEQYSLPYIYSDSVYFDFDYSNTSDTFRIFYQRKHTRSFKCLILLIGKSNFYRINIDFKKITDSVYITDAYLHAFKQDFPWVLSSGEFTDYKTEVRQKSSEERFALYKTCVHIFKPIFNLKTQKQKQIWYKTLNHIENYMIGYDYEKVKYHYQTNYDNFSDLDLQGKRSPYRKIESFIDRQIIGGYTNSHEVLTYINLIKKDFR